MISQVCFVAGNSIICRAAVGRPLPTADVGYPVAQIGCQLSGGEIAGPTTGASRPIGDIRTIEFVAAKLSSNTEQEGGVLTLSVI